MGNERGIRTRQEEPAHRHHGTGRLRRQGSGNIVGSGEVIIAAWLL